MTRSQQDLASLIEQIRDGSETASKDLVSRYGTHILRIVRHKLKRAMRSKFDSQDFVQAVWASFFALLPGHFTFAGPEELIAFLTELAQNKVVEEVRQRLVLQKYNVNRECSLNPANLSPADSRDVRQPMPDDIAIAREEWQLLVDRQPALYRRIVLMLSAGQNREEVAQALGISEKTVDRVLQKFLTKAAHESF